jgi:hypothetical protein
LLLICLLIVSAKADDEKELVLQVRTKSLDIDYLVPRERFLAETNGWSPAQGPFPGNIKQYADRAAEHLAVTKSLGKKIFLGSVTMGLVRHRDTRETSNGPIVERWVLTLDFTTEPTIKGPASVYSVVMLLDGTIAEEHLLRGNVQSTAGQK